MSEAMGVRAPTLSVVISVRDEAAHLERCLAALAAQRGELNELIVVDDGSCDGSGGVAERAGCEVVTLPAGRGISAARNIGARRAGGDVIAFIDADTRVLDGWARALREAFAEGSVLAGGKIEWPVPRTLAEWHRASGNYHDETGRNGLLPFASGAHFVIRRDVFIELGGFDESMPLAEDVDLSLRVQLAGHPISFIPEARLIHYPRPRLADLFRQLARHSRGHRLTEIKFRQFPFMRMDRGRRTLGRVLLASLTRLAIAGTAGDRRRLAAPFLTMGVTLAKRFGMRKADLQIMCGRIPLPAAHPYRDPEQHNTASPLPGMATFLLLGSDRLLMAVLRLLVEQGFGAIAAPPGLEREALERWHESAPWSMRLARAAVRDGWGLALETAALRIEREQPRTWGSAFVTLHRVHAWAHSRPRYGIAARGAEGLRLAERLPDVPIILAGGDPALAERAAVTVSRADLLLHRKRTFRRIRHVVRGEAQGRPVRFVIVNMERSGSTWLSQLLNSHPSILCHGELLNPERIGFSGSYAAFSTLPARWTLADRDANRRDFIEAVFADSCGHTAVGLKVLNWQAPELLRELLADPDTRKVILNRDNRVRAYLSRQRARMVRRWTGLPYDGLRVRIDADELLAYCRRHEEVYEQLGRTSAGTPVHHVTYEELLRDERRVDRIVEFVGATPTRDPLEALIEPQSQDRLCEVVENFDELDQVLAGTPFHAQLGD